MGCLSSAKREKWGGEKEKKGGPPPLCVNDCNPSLLLSPSAEEKERVRRKRAKAQQQPILLRYSSSPIILVPLSSSLPSSANKRGRKRNMCAKSQPALGFAFEPKYRSFNHFEPGFSAASLSRLRHCVRRRGRREGNGLGDALVHSYPKSCPLLPPLVAART